ncbi:hypothetical protein Y032_0002g727 [Ancylostoma ceylanicum]|nr:hypothetical protein Y032_0002g727 [Ancylostoma ceylanicum]
MTMFFYLLFALLLTTFDAKFTCKYKSKAICLVLRLLKQDDSDSPLFQQILNYTKEYGIIDDALQDEKIQSPVFEKFIDNVYKLPEPFRNYIEDVFNDTAHQKKDPSEKDIEKSNKLLCSYAMLSEEDLKEVEKTYPGIDEMIVEECCGAPLEKQD